jgi:HEAT repeat protein
MKGTRKNSKADSGILLCAILITTLSYQSIASLVKPDRAKQLQAKGYKTDTPEQIIEATKSKSYFIRHIALELLTQRTGEKAISTLKEALNDPRIEVRWRAAH